MITALALVLKASAMFAAALLTVRLARRWRASTRHLVLAAAFFVVLVLPLAAVVLPSTDVQLAMNRGTLLQGSQPLDAPRTAAERAGRPAASMGSPGSTAAGSPRSIIDSARVVLTVVWAAGAFAALAALASAFWQLGRMRRDGLPYLPLLPLARQLALDAGVRRPVDVMTHERVSSPMTFGLLRVSILLPADVAHWSAADVRRALVHELEHARRGDWPILLAARTVCALHWFNPLAWAAHRRLALEAERACDDAVVCTADVADYAEQLVALASRMGPLGATAMLGMARRSDLVVRVSALLDARQRRGRAGRPVLAVAFAAALAAVLAVGPLRAVAAGPPSAGSEPGQRSQRAPSDHALYRAAERGDVDRIAELIQAGTNVNAALEGDGTPLIGAARAGKLAAVRMLLDAGADPDLPVDGDGSALIMAAREGHVEVVALLLDRGASIDQVVDGDENALIQASGEGQLAAVKLLVSRGADVNARVWAARGIRGGVAGGVAGGVPGGVPGGVSGGVAGGVPGGVDGEWRTPLSMARAGGHSAVVAFLESVGARE